LEFKTHVPVEKPRGGTSQEERKENLARPSADGAFDQ